MILLSLLVPPVLACGGFAPEAGSLAASDAQQALFDLGAEHITVTYRAGYAGDAADFAWVLAVPGQVSLVAEGDAEQLDAIALASAPQVEVDRPESAPGCGCAGFAQVDGGDRTDGADVVVTSTGVAGDYTYTTLAASDADGLIDWLTEHGYDVSLLADAVAGYVADPLDYEFVAVQLRPDVPALTEGGSVLQPLAITYGTAADGELHAVFPAKLGRTSSVEAVRTEIFVLGSGTATLSGWDAIANPAETDGNTWDVVGPDYVDATGLYSEFLLEKGGIMRQMWLAYAGGYTTADGDRWLTRYDSIVYPDTNSVDPVFADSTRQETASTVIYLMNEIQYEEEYPSETAFGLVGVIGALVWRRRFARQAPA